MERSGMSQAKARTLGLVVPLVLAVAAAIALVAFSDANGQSTKASKTAGIAAPTTLAPNSAMTPLQRQAAACSSALTPWTEYIADTNDYTGWVETIGADSPLVQLPQAAARIFQNEEPTKGAAQASADGFAHLDQTCATFAAAHPTYPFKRLPGAPSVAGD